MHLNFLTSASPSPFFPGVWRDPDDASALGYRSVGYWRDVCLAAEVGGCDSVTFLPTAELPRLDPMMVLPAAAAATSHVGLVVAGGSDIPVAALALQLSTLDHLSGGRVGWLIDDHGDQKVREAVALWETSWSENAMAFDTRANMLVVADEVDTPPGLDAPHGSEPSRQRTPCLYGHLDALTAAQFAEVIMVSPVPVEAAAEEVERAFDAVDAHDRSFDEVRLVMTADVVVGADAGEAKRLRRHLDRYGGEGTSAGLTFVGTAAEVVADMAGYLDAGFVGFSLRTAPLPGGVQRLQRLLSPALREAGLLRSSFDASTLREHWYGYGNHQLAADHPAR